MDNPIRTLALLRDRTAQRIRHRIGERRQLRELLRELGGEMRGVARQPANVVARACPVCDRDDHEPTAAVDGPVYAFHRCRGCSLLYAPRLLEPSKLRDLLAERPALRNLWKRYWELMRTDAEAARGTALYGPLLERLLAALGSRGTRPGTAIDVGCGFGKLLSELSLHFREALGLELDRRTAREGERLFGVKIASEALETLDRPPGSVDLIVMNQILEHLRDVGGVVRAAHRLLRPGGVLYVSIPHGASLGMRVLGGAHVFVATHKHVNLFTAAALRELAARSRFRVATLGTDDVVDLSAADWLLARPSPRLVTPALLVNKAVRGAAARTRLPSRLGAGAHLEAILTRPL